MTEEEYRQLRCIGKMSYKSMTAANIAKAAILKRESKKLESYHCRYCGLFHVKRILELKKKK
jgi:hypothetical protein